MTLFEIECSTLDCKTLINVIADFINKSFRLIVYHLIFNIVIFPFAVFQGDNFNSFVNGKQFYNIQSFLVDLWESYFTIFDFKMISQILGVILIKCSQE